MFLWSMSNSSGYLWGGRMELSFMTAITELSIRGAGQKDRSSGNVIKHFASRDSLSAKINI